jgi:hypothetical protein
MKGANLQLFYLNKSISVNLIYIVLPYQIQSLSHRTRLFEGHPGQSLFEIRRMQTNGQAFLPFVEETF